jgi:predicted PolB exonuclease-like 3'-5' exonuclease
MVIIDIETIPTGVKLTVDELKVPATMSVQKTIDEWKANKAPAEVEKEYRHRALVPHKCEVVCWAIKTEGHEYSTHVTGDEKVVLLELESKLKEIVKSPHEIIWVGANIRNFDLPILRQRAWKYKLTWLSKALSVPSSQIIDLIDLFTGSRSKEYLVGKDEMCRFFDIVIDDDNTGAMVYDLYLAGDVNKIISHCEADVVKEYELYKRME